MLPHPFDIAPISRQIWDQKYRLKSPDGTPLDADIEATWWRVARAVAAAEKGGRSVREAWAGRFHEMLSDFTFLPAGRIIAGAGTGRRVTLFNCFVMGRIEDDLGSIFDNVREAALTMQQGGGIGHDFSTLRPQGAPVRSTGSDASGPVSFMDVWDAMCRTIMSSGQRRGAMMGTMRCDHPDIERFIAVKASAEKLRNFNLSVLVTDAFIEAVRQDQPWSLMFGGKVWRTLPARRLWDQIMRATYDYAEPGVIFIDRINARNNLGYCEEIHATNPCGEQPLPPHGACLLGSINLARLVVDPFASRARLDLEKLSARVRLAVRFLDDCIDVSDYPLPAQRKEARAKRRIGLGVTGLADALIMLGLRYDQPDARRSAESWMAAIEQTAYLASSDLAAEKGTFALFDRDKMLARPGVAAMPGEVRSQIARSGLRNGCLVSIAPTGTISLLAGNVSSGIEPVFDLEYTRRIRQANGSFREETVADFAFAAHRSIHDGTTPGNAPPASADRLPLPAAFVTANELAPRAHLEMQAALQRHVDSSISKTINCPPDIPFEAFKDVYLQAYDLGLKGCTTFRANPITGSVLAHPGTDDTPTSGPVAALPAAQQPPASPLHQVQSKPGSPGIVYMSKPLERDPALAGYTYKLKWPGSDHAIYVTINDIERDGRRRPFEIFINTKNLEHYAWTVALTRMISAVFRRGGDVSFVVEELKAVFDPQGGHWVDGRYVPSLLAAIGEVIERHMLRTGFLQSSARLAPDPAASGQLEATGPASELGAVLAHDRGDEHARDHATVASAQWPAQWPAPPPSPGKTADRNAPLCPRCARPEMIREAGCWTCRSCGYSRCG